MVSFGIYRVPIDLNDDAKFFTHMNFEFGAIHYSSNYASVH